MGDLLKEAIADAKAVRETALANAKAALEEAFTPKLQSMLSQKLKEDDMEDEVPAEEEEDAEEIAVSDEEELPAEEEDEEIPSDDEVEDVPVADDEEGEKDVDVDVADDDDDDDDDEDLDLEAIIRELEDEDVEEDEEEVSEEVDQSSAIGNTDEEGYEEENFDDPAKPLNVTEGEDEEAAEEDEEKVDEIVDLSELLDGLTEEDEEEDDSEEVKAENIKLTASLKEHRKVVKYLKDKLNEVNLLNAKLLYTNKLFKGYNLSNDQKLKIVETFDRAKNSREVKLVFSTLAESFAGKTGSAVTKINESKSIASKSTGSTKPKKVISEGNELANRFKKLAGII